MHIKQLVLRAICVAVVLRKLCAYNATQSVCIIYIYIYIYFAALMHNVDKVDEVFGNRKMDKL